MGTDLALAAYVVFFISDIGVSPDATTIPWYVGVATIAPFILWQTVFALPAVRQAIRAVNNGDRKSVGNFVSLPSKDTATSVYFAMLASAASLYSRLAELTWVHPAVLVAFLCMHCHSDRSIISNWCFIAATTVSCALLAGNVGVTRLVLVFAVVHLAPPRGPVFSLYRRSEEHWKDGVESYFKFDRHKRVQDRDHIPTPIGIITLFFGVFSCVAGEIVITRLTDSSIHWDTSAYKTVTISVLAIVTGIFQIILLLRSKKIHLISPMLTTTASCIACAYVDKNVYLLALYVAHASESFELFPLALWDLLFFVMVNVRQLDVLVREPELWRSPVFTNVACLCMIAVGLEITRRKRDAVAVKTCEKVDCTDAMISINPASSMIFGTIDIASLSSTTATSDAVENASSRQAGLRSAIPTGLKSPQGRNSSHISHVSLNSGISIIPSQVEPWSQVRDENETSSCGTNAGATMLPVPERRRVRAHSMTNLMESPMVTINQPTVTVQEKVNVPEPEEPDLPKIFDRRPRAHSICVEAMQKENMQQKMGARSGVGHLTMTQTQVRSSTPIQPDDLHEALVWNQVRKGSVYGAPIGIDRFKELQEWSARNSPTAASVAGSVQASRVGSMQPSRIASIVQSARASQFGSPQGSGSATPKGEVKLLEEVARRKMNPEDSLTPKEEVPTRASSAPTNENWSRRSSVSVIEMNRSPLPGVSGGVPQQPGHVNTSLASSNKSSAACSMNASVMSSVHQSRRSSAFYQKRGIRRGDTSDMNTFLGEGTIVGLDVMPEETTDSDDDSYDDMESPNAMHSPSFKRYMPDMPMSPDNLNSQCIPEEMDGEDTEYDPRTHSILGERRESGLDLNQLLSSCPNLSVKDMAEKNSELGNMSLMELLESIQKSAVFPVGMDMAPSAGFSSDMDMAPVEGNVPRHLQYPTPVCRRPSVDTAQMQRNLYGLLPSHRQCNCTGNVHTCMSPMSSAGASLAHSPHWGRSEVPTVVHSQLASIVHSIAQSERASVTCSPIHSDEEKEKEAEREEETFHTIDIIDMTRRKSLHSSGSFDLEKRAKKYKQKLAPKVKVPASPIPEGDEDALSRRPSFSQEPSCTEGGQPAVVSPTSNFARFSQVTHEECATMLRENTKTLVVDVRGRDFCGGNIPGSRNMRTRALQEHPKVLVDLLTELNVDHVIFTCMYSVLRAISCAVALQQFMQAEHIKPEIAISILKEGFHGWINYWNDRNNVEEMVENFDSEQWVTGENCQGAMVHVMDAVWSDKGHALLFNALQEIAADSERW